MAEPAAPLLEEPLLRTWARGLVIAAVAAVFLAYAGPFNTGEGPFATRLVYWGVLMLGGAIWGRAAGLWLTRFPVFEGRLWLTAAVLTVMIAIPGVFLVWDFTSVMFQQPLMLATLPFFIIPVVGVSAIMTVISMAADRRPRETHAAAGDAPRFLERLPLKLKGAEIYAVSAEDHYLRIHTDRGSDLILMRLADAVDELQGLEGAQTHRSWWVAKSAVTGAERGDGRAVFTLKSGEKAPVSRTYARVLRREGWY
ncbi:MAG TPA: LytTR family DNA-binding domain-containing protein [Caulobacteraceae bacterium]|jgi:DNA-binding LytR/AlgR family response regulator|nr:LytTR family DNA-binding domain-containing protein [Caulobacteraceae bacterium]